MPGLLSDNAVARVMRLVFGALVLLALGLEAAWRWLPLPAALSAPVPSTRLLARDGTLLHETVNPQGSRGGLAPLASLSPHAVAATLAGEDHRFYHHHGVDVVALARAVWLNVRLGRVAFGGSTITQQLVRLCLPGPRTLGQKLREMWWASALERHWDKQQILEHYLARAPYGGQVTGLQEAALQYFGVAPGNLSLGQASLLSVIPRAPRRYDPRTPDGLDAALSRRTHVLDLLVKQGHIQPEDVARALEEPITVLPAAWPLQAPHAVMRLLREASGTNAREIVTTLEPGIQQRAETLVTRTVDELGVRGVHQAAVLVVEVATGSVRAYVGSASFQGALAGQVDGVVAPRSPGSTLKPLFYAAALDHNMTPATVLYDVARPFAAGRGQYLPRNFDGRQHGPVLLRDALANSYNLASVDLAARLGVGALPGILRNFGVLPLQVDQDALGLGVVLGGVDVTLWDVATAYLTLARSGVGGTLRLREDAPPGAARQVVTVGSARTITNILMDDVARSRAFGRQSALALPFEAAVKTGTSKDFRDNWAVGYSSRYLVAVWAGDFSGRSMTGVSGVTGAGLLWHRLMRSIHDQDPPPLPRPAGVMRPVCLLSGLTPGPYCSGVRQEVFAQRSAPLHTCTLHQAEGVLRLEEALVPWGVRAGLPVTAAVTRVKVLSPGDGEVFSQTSARGETAQGVLLIAAAPSGEAVSLVLDTTVVAQGAGLVRATPVLDVGTHVLEARGVNGVVDRVSFELRP